MSQLNGIWEEIGEFGHFQKRVYAQLNFLTILQCCQVFLLVFIADKPQWECSENEHLYLDQTTQNRGNPCYRNGSICRNITFDGEFTSIASEWNLVCDQEYKTNIAQVVLMAGSFLGAILLGGIADRYGRRSAIIFMQFFAAVFYFASGLVQSFEQFVILRFLGAGMLKAGGTTIFILISEILGPKYRDKYLTIHQVFYALGYIVLTGLAYFVRDWRNLSFIISTPALLCAVFFLKDICESPQWLLEKGKLDETKGLLRKIAKQNGFEPPVKSLEKLTNNEKNTESAQSVMEIFCSKGYLKKISVLCLLCNCTSMLYYGLSFASNIYSGNKYISFCLSGVVEIPALFVSMWLLKSGRRMPMFYLCITGGLLCFMCSWLLGVDESRVGFFVMLSAMFGKFAVAASYNILYIFSSELFNATVLSFSMGLCSTASSLGGILAPVVVGLDVYDKRLPMLIFGIGGVLSAMAVIILPETSELQPQEMDKKKK